MIQYHEPGIHRSIDRGGGGGVGGGSDYVPAAHHTPDGLFVRQ